MAEQWYYKLGRHEEGPVSQQDVKRLAASGQIRRYTMLRQGETGAWIRAEHIADLFPANKPPGSPVAGVTDDLSQLESMVLGLQPGGAPQPPALADLSPLGGAGLGAAGVADLGSAAGLGLGTPGVGLGTPGSNPLFLSGSTPFAATAGPPKRPPARKQPAQLPQKYVVMSVVLGVLITLTILVVGGIFGLGKLSQLRVEWANERVATAVQQARADIQAGRFDAAESILSDAASEDLCTNRDQALALLEELAKARAAADAAALFKKAEDFINQVSLVQAIPVLEEYLAQPHAAEVERAQDLLGQCRLALSDTEAVTYLSSLSDLALEGISQRKSVPTHPEITHPKMLEFFSNRVRFKVGAEVARRAAEKRKAVAVAQTNPPRTAVAVPKDSPATPESSANSSEPMLPVELPVGAPTERDKRRAAAIAAFNPAHSKSVQRRFEDYLDQWFAAPMNERRTSAWALVGHRVLKALHAAYVDGEMEPVAIRRILGKDYSLFQDRTKDSVVLLPVADETAVRRAAETFLSDFGDAAPDGARYTFNWVWQEAQERLKEPLPVQPAGAATSEAAAE